MSSRSTVPRRAIAVALASFALAGCGGDDSGGYDYPEYSAEAGRTADTIIANCGDVEPEDCDASQLMLAAESLSHEDYLDVCYAVVEKRGRDPELCP